MTVEGTTDIIPSAGLDDALNVEIDDAYYSGRCQQRDE